MAAWRQVIESVYKHPNLVEGLTGTTLALALASLALYAVMDSKGYDNSGLAIGGCTVASACLIAYVAMLGIMKGAWNWKAKLAGAVILVVALITGLLGLPALTGTQSDDPVAVPDTEPSEGPGAEPQHEVEADKKPLGGAGIALLVLFGLAALSLNVVAWLRRFSTQDLDRMASTQAE